MNESVPFEDVSYFTGFDYSIFILILSFSLAIGIYFGFFSNELKTAEDYLVGGHKMQTIPIAISLVSSQLSAIAIMTIPAEIYSFGWQYMLLLPTLFFITIGTNYLFLPVFYHNSIDNCYVYLEMRFGKTTRRLLTFLFVVLNLFFLPVIMYIPSLAFVEVTKHSIHEVNIVICYICVIYTMLGGIKAVVWTDVLQAAVMVASVILVAVLGIIKVGGLSEVWNRAVDGNRIFSPIMSLDPAKRITFWNIVSSMFVMWTCHITFSQNCVQRLVSLPSLTKAKRSMIIFLFGVVLIMLFNSGTGIIMYSYYHNCDPVKIGIVTKYDKLMPRFVQDVAGHIRGMPGIFISCVFSASLSTVSAALHSVSGVIYSDYVRPMKWFADTDVNANRTMRLIIFLIGTLCAFSGILVENFQSIFQLINTVSGMTSGAKFGAFTFAMLYPWGNEKGVLSGIIISVVVVCSIIVNTQYHIAQGKLKYPIIPTSVEGCSNDTINFITNITTTTPTPFSINDDFAFYKISFQWYPIIGVITMWIPSMIISYLTGGQDFNGFNVQLLSPAVRHLVPKKYRHTELKNMKNSKNAEIDEKPELTGLILPNGDNQTQIH